ncbi:MAG TPA: M24 family metallopeptidase [Bryobacteraceae bacterium]|nr:M24 family metallopeptidase [Bryobacteraceae bacterium]
MPERFGSIQDKLREECLDGWLFFDHHQRDPLAYRILGFQPPRTPTRRWYYFIPAQGAPRGLVHRIEAGMLDALPGEKSAYASWQHQVDGLRALLGGARRVAMQYSPNCAIPYVAMVDAGTVELIRGFGTEVVSAADLVQFFEARWTAANLENHLAAGRLVDGIRRDAFTFAFDRLGAGAPVNEYDVKQFILDRFREAGLFTDHGPIVAVNDNASNPHYEPTPELHKEIRKGDLLLIDLWAKMDKPDGVYYDITWTGYCGPQPPAAMAKVFDVVSGARDAAVRVVKESFREGGTLRGFQVDDAARGYIRDAGYEQYFIHRTGHSIGADVHGAGANMDNLETHDVRSVIPWTCFSVEPGIYLPEFGIRSELNVFVGDDGARVTGETQERLVTP